MITTSSSTPSPARAAPLRWTTFAAPSRFHALTGRLLAPLWALAALLGLAGLYVGFFVAPTDAQQGESYRILFIHVPAAWMSMVMYLALALWAVVGWVFNARLATLLARAIAPTGALFTVIALWTGALWGKPAWGTWWVWDARLTSELILLFMYLGFMALSAAIADPRRAARASALVAGLGVINVPVIYFSVRWWSTLHQGASISMSAAPRMASQMLLALALTTLACWAYAFAASFARARRLVRDAERDAAWLS